MRALAALLLVGCTVQPFSKRDAYQDQAVSTVWHDTYHMVDKTPPDLRWIPQSQLNCGLVKGQLVAFYTGDPLGDVGTSGLCVYGATYIPWPYMSVIANSTGSEYHDGVLAHEFYHAFLYFTKNDPDIDHKDPGFGTVYGYPHGAVDDANDNLKAAGL